MPDAFLLDSSAFLTQHRLSLADVFIAASAQRLGAVLVHKDPETAAFGRNSYR